MAGINKVILVGNLGNDPDITYGRNDNAICTISVATSERWKDKQTGEMQEKTEWHRVKFFGRLAEIAGEYLSKGQQVYIEGKITYGKYTDKNGVERYTSDIVAHEMQMLGRREGGGETGGQGASRGSSSNRGGGRGAASGGSRRQASSERAPAAQQQPQQGGFDDTPFDDDIPF